MYRPYEQSVQRRMDDICLHYQNTGVCSLPPGSSMQMLFANYKNPSIPKISLEFPASADGKFPRIFIGEEQSELTLIQGTERHPNATDALLDLLAESRPKMATDSGTTTIPSSAGSGEESTALLDTGSAASARITSSSEHPVDVASESQDADDLVNLLAMESKAEQTEGERAGSGVGWICG